MTLTIPDFQPALGGGTNTVRYAKCIEASSRVRWDISRDVIRGRRFDMQKKFLPDGLSFVDKLPFLSQDHQRLLSQIQGRTYANMFALVERFIGAKTVQRGHAHALGDQVAMEALIRMTDEELKHQELFRRLEAMMAASMPAGYSFLPQPNDVARAVLAKSDWAVLGLTLHIEIFTVVHYRTSIENRSDLSELWQDVFKFHWLEESQHAVLDELEWRLEHESLSLDERDRAVTEFIELVGAVDSMLQIQACADAIYFGRIAGGAVTQEQLDLVQDTVLRAYRHTYIVSGAREPRFSTVLAELTTAAQLGRVLDALTPIGHHVAG
jgi:hypothetical protein